MTSVELIAIEPKIVGEELKMEVKLSNVARWATKEIFKTEISIEDWLGFLNDALEQLENPEAQIRESIFSIESLKSVTKLVANKTYFFSLSKSHWKHFIHHEIEKLYLCGIITLEKPTKQSPSKSKRKKE